MAFVGFFGTAPDALRRLHTRASFLCAPILHLSLSGTVALAYTTRDGTEPAPFPTTPITVATDGRGCGEGELLQLSRLYLRYGRRMRHRILTPLCFAVCDSRKNLVLLGATGGRRCYFEEDEEGFWFSSVPTLLRAPCALTLALLKQKK